VKFGHCCLSAATGQSRQPGLKPQAVGAILPAGPDRICVLHLRVVVVAKYLVLFGFTDETMKRFVAKPSDRTAVVGELAESVGGSLESYY
jgi:hypothetical protein